MKSVILAVLSALSIQARADVVQSTDALNLRPAALPLCLVNGQLRVDTDFSIWICSSGTWTTLGSSGGGTWGSISGTLSDQTDLQSALNGKEPTISAGTSGQYFRGDKTFQDLNKAAVGLGNVDNTSDANKPISTAAQTALNAKEPSITGGTTAQFWRGDKAFTNELVGPLVQTRTGLGTTVQPGITMQNTTAAANNAQQVSPALVQSARGWKTNSVAGSQSVDFRSYVLPVQGTTTPLGNWKLQYSQNGGAYNDALDVLTNISAGLSIPLLKVSGFLKSVASNSSTIDTLQNLDLSSTGSRVNAVHSFGSTIRSGWQTTDQGSVNFYSAGPGSSYFFKVGSNISSQNDVLQIYSGGLYNYGGSYNQSNVTAGQSDISPPATLNTYGSLALRGSYKTANATLDANETMVYCDASNANICSGTPSASCSSHLSEGACSTHSPAGCSWQPETSESCGIYGGVDQTTCESNSGCTFTQSPCASQNNTDQSSCENQNSPYGGSCSWDTSTCSSQVSTSSCNATAGCGADTSGDCGSLSDGGGDGSLCGTQSECSYDSESGSCSGSYFVSCNGNLCANSYYNGSCDGTHVLAPAVCSGVALCSALGNSGACAAETGCSWVSGMTLTLPPSSQANDGNTSRLYSIVNVGSTGTVTVVPSSGGTPVADSILGYGSGVVLNAQNERVSVHHHRIIGQCSTYNSNESSCTATTGCAWNPSVTCSDYNGNSFECASHSCTFNEGDSTCSGPGSASSCSGQFTSSNPWIIHQLSN